MRNETELKAPRWFVQWFLNNCQMAFKLDQVRQINDGYKCYLKGKKDQRTKGKKNA